MKPTVALHDLDGIRDLVDSDFPLVVGGPDSDIRVPELERGRIQLYIGQDEDGIFAQPAEDADAQLLCNGFPLATSQWLHPGDVLEIGISRLVIEGDDQGIRLRIFKLMARDPARTPGQTFPRGEAPAAEAPIRVSPIKFTPSPVVRPRRKRWRPSPGLLVEAALLVALAAVLWFVFTARSVSIVVEPAPDRLAVKDGLPSPRIGGRFLLRPGTYTVLAEREGYRPLSETIAITKAAGQGFRFELVQLPGTLDVVAGDVEGARVFIDGEPVGSTPLEGLELAAGEHLVEIRAERYQDHIGQVEISGPGSYQSYQVELIPAWAQVRIRSEPAGATVIVDGSTAGETPLTTDLADGSHSFELVLAGYRAVRGRLRVVANEAQDTGLIKLQPADGNLTLSSDPPEATVAVNGVFKGSTPLDLDLTPGQEHEIELSKAGFEAQVERIVVNAGEQTSVRVVLVPSYGEVSVSSRPPNAELYVDGEPSGRTGQTLKLTAVLHEIEVRLSGHETFRTTVMPNPELMQSIEVSLQSLDLATSSPRTITSPQGVELLLIPAGRFTMGASRREPGRRANETLREVELTKPFYLAVREVSNREFREFSGKHLSGGAGSHSLETDHHPVVRVTWEQAARYCNWLSQQHGLPPVYVERSGRLVARSPLPTGYRLPTEAEWAWAARVPTGSATLKYAWGNTLPVPPASDNYGGRSAQALLGGALPDYDDSYAVTAPVGSFSPNARGLYNMGGNVSEWVHDVYTIYTPSPGDIAADPTGPDEGEYHVIRGASWMDDSVTELRLSYRDYGDEARPDVGFRFARSVTVSE